MSKISQIDGLQEFLGGKPIKSFDDFTMSKDDGVVIVIGCYLGVEEGVDMWIDHCSNKPEPRYCNTILCFIYIYTCNFALGNYGMRPTIRFPQVFLIMSLSRFRMRVNAGDYENEALFLLTDDMVRKVAPLTCKLLLDTVRPKFFGCLIVFVLHFILLTSLCFAF